MHSPLTHVRARRRAEGNTTLLLMVLVPSLLLACERDSEEDPAPLAAPTRVATFNTGWARGYVARTDERIAPAIASVHDLTADVVCLEEVWEPADLSALLQGVKDVFPHSFTADTTDQSVMTIDPACTSAELEPLASCVMTHCAGTTDLVGCVLAHCGAEFGATTAGCQQCLAANVSKTFDEILQTCSKSSSSMAYQGRNGLVLLSRLPFDEANHIVFDAFLIRRVALHAVIATGWGPAHVFCTHLTAPLSEIRYAGKFGSWDAEQAKQVGTLISHVNQTIGADGQAIILGDMNTGPAIGAGITSLLPQNFQMFIDAGFTAPYLDANEPQCTWCRSNSLVADTDDDLIIDHVLFKNFDPSLHFAAHRILDRPVGVEVNNTPTETSLSDHFGVAVELGQ